MYAHNSVDGTTWHVARIEDAGTNRPYFNTYDPIWNEHGRTYLDKALSRKLTALVNN